MKNVWCKMTAVLWFHTYGNRCSDYGYLCFIWKFGLWFIFLPLRKGRGVQNERGREFPDTFGQVTDWRRKNIWWSALLPLFVAPTSSGFAVPLPSATFFSGIICSDCFEPLRTLYDFARVHLCFFLTFYHQYSIGSVLAFATNVKLCTVSAAFKSHFIRRRC